ncbi:CdaR family transcriptional regulator [Williamsia sp.]|uniref:PucR family transcriptional regulator n=1 Tax=Williamsia sp. TaxID=1872085 RepID=UPI001A33881D|nr:PucR family transcriptional regulator [Williamsia sp.]MBJ7288262.1 helix-turn-helix domain-containing protein [Williamsia sp.]
MTDALHQTFRAYLRDPKSAADLRPLAHHLVDRAAATIPSHRVPTPDASAHVVDALVETSMRAAMATVPDAMGPSGYLRTGPEPLVRLGETVAEWAQDGVDLVSVLALLDRGFDIVFTALADRAASTGRFTTDIKLLVDVRADVATQAAGVFAVTDTRAVTASSRRAFGEALLAGRIDIGGARRVGLAVADRYQVIALAVEERVLDDDGRSVPGASTVGSLDSVVRRILGHQALSVLSDAGGTVVLPADGPHGLVTAEAVTALGHAVGAEITATRVVGTAESIPDMALRADELLDLARAIGRPPGVYTMDDLVVEYQITRPGPALDRLAALIHPLEDASAELLETLRVHMSCGMNRRETARRLSVHPNTVDNRMTRVAAALGLDLNRPKAIAQTQSAILAFDTVRRPGRRGHLPSPA